MRIRDHQGSASIIADEKNLTSIYPGPVVLYRCSTERKGKGSLFPSMTPMEIVLVVLIAPHSNSGQAKSSRPDYFPLDVNIGINMVHGNPGVTSTLMV